MKRAWVEVDLQAVADNVGFLRREVHPARIMAVVKSDAYGYGLAPVARAALAGGATWLAVADVDEGIALRRAGIAAPTLVLGRTTAARAPEVVAHDLSQAVDDLRLSHTLAAAARELGKKARVHVEVDTGMGLSGIAPQRAPRLVEQLLSLPGLEVEGVFTHFATAGERDLGFARTQAALFHRCLEGLADLGFTPPLRHACNSAATFTVPEARLDMVRVGAALYGIWSAQAAPPPRAGLLPAIAVKSRIETVRELPAGASVGYDRAAVLTRPSRVAVVPFGYGDGLPRAYSHRGYALVRGRRCQVLGLVSMNRCALDVSELPRAEPGDEVVFVGSQGGDTIRVEEVARHLGMGLAEFMWGHRLPRVYLGEIGG